MKNRDTALSNFEKISGLFILAFFLYIVTLTVLPAIGVAEYQKTCNAADEAAHANCPEYDLYEFIPIWFLNFFNTNSGFFTVLFTFFLVGVGWRQAGISGRQAEVAEKQMLITARQTDIIEKQKEIARLEFLSSHRPRLKVRNVVVGRWVQNDLKEIAPFIKNQKVIGKLHLVNAGDGDAILMEMNIQVIWVKHLPMSPPTELQGPATDVFAGKLLRPGEILELSFTSREDMDEEGPNIAQGHSLRNLYVMGWMTFDDANQVTRRTGFCRKWQPDKGGLRGRFEKVSNEDYEYED